MEWFVGDIADAVEQTKANHACLIIFIESKDESSKRLEAMFTHENIQKSLSDLCFVALRFTQDTDAYMHFSRIYRLVPVPSIFFIGTDGTPIEIVTSILKSLDELQAKINNVLRFIQDSSITRITTSESSCVSPVATRNDTVPVTESASGASKDATEVRRQREQHFKEIQDDIRRNKLAEQEARKRVRAQIVADRREQSQNLIKNISIPPKQEQSKTIPLSASQARLLFRFPNGETSIQIFELNDKFSCVRAFVRDQVLSVRHNNFRLATSYPKRELGVECDDKTLLELGLCPNAVILIILLKTNGQTGAVRERFGNVFTILRTILQGILNISNYFRNAIFRSPPQQSNAHGKKDDDFVSSNLDASLRRLSPREGQEMGNDGTARRWAGGSNVHRLRDQSQKDDDDNATWNGNSTQQQ